MLRVNFGSRFGALARVGLLGLPLGLSLFSSCVEQEEDKPTDEDLAFIKQNLLAAPPSLGFPANTDIDGKVVYLGLDSSMNPIEPGKDVKLTHYWKVNENPGAGWRVFTHLNGGPNLGFINVDHGPMKGKYPVTQWKKGDIIKDEQIIRLPATWQFDKLEVYSGLWKGAQRMTIVSGPKDDSGRVLCATIPVKGAVKAAPPAVKRYVARKVAKAPKLDGKLDDQAWKDAPSTGAFVNTLTGAPQEPKTEAKLLWDKDHLYFAFDNVDTDVWSTLNKRDDKLWQQEAVEIMIDADKNGKTYVEFQVAPNGAIFDTFLPEYRKYEDVADPKRKPYDWNSKIKAVVKVDGTVGKRDDKDIGWAVEIALPLADVNGLSKEGPAIPPAVGDVWKLNMFRLDAPEGKPQVAVGWSPPLVGDFHALDKFGEIVFGDEKGETAKPVLAGKDQLKEALGGLEAGAPGAEKNKKIPAAKKAAK